MPYTSPDNFFYPGGAQDNNLSKHVQDLAESIQAKFTAQETWNSWTPQFDTNSNGGISAVGSGGHATGHYRRSSPDSGALVTAEFRFFIGTSPTVIAGTFVLFLPVSAYNWGGAAFACQNQTVGEWSLRKSGTSPVHHYTGTLGLWFDDNGTAAHFAGTPRDVGGAASATQTSRYRMDSNDPITFAAADILTGHLIYRAN